MHHNFLPGKRMKLTMNSMSWMNWYPSQMSYIVFLLQKYNTLQEIMETNLIPQKMKVKI